MHGVEAQDLDTAGRERALGSVDMTAGDDAGIGDQEGTLSAELCGQGPETVDAVLTENDARARRKLEGLHGLHYQPSAL